jgi:hypothetical protein
MQHETSPSLSLSLSLSLHGATARAKCVRCHANERVFFDVLKKILLLHVAITSVNWQPHVSSELDNRKLMNDVVRSSVETMLQLLYLYNLHMGGCGVRDTSDLITIGNLKGNRCNILR